MAAQRTFEQRVANLLTANDFRFVREATARGLVMDVAVDLGGDRWVFLELKARRADRSWAEAQARQYESLIGSPVAVVFPGKRLGNQAPRVVYEEDLVDWLRTQLVPRLALGQAQALIESPKPVIFAAMPFERRFDDTLDVMVRAASEVGASINRVDKSVHNGATLAKIKEGISQCRFMVADLSEHNPNVLFELGFGQALAKRSVHLCFTPRRELPFDVRDQYAIRYQVGSTTSVLQELIEHFRLELAS